MIVVIADDISGAAELAGAALSHGLTAEVQTDFVANSPADVVCIDTDSRSYSPENAALAVAKATRCAAAARPTWIYKKCDSVLRGSVLAESRAMLSVLQKKRILVVPANPSRGRVIRDGLYFVGEQPLHETAFSLDPEYPRTTSRVADMLGKNLESIVLPDVRSAAAVKAYAATVDDETLPVGGVDFFAALLRQRCPHSSSRLGAAPDNHDTGTVLLVCGSAASWITRRDEARSKGVPVFEVPHELDSIRAALRTTGKVMIGIGDGAFTHGHAPAELVQALAETVATVINEVKVKRLLLEGGATASAVVRGLGWSRLRACELSPQGIGILAPTERTDLRVFIKPGSYAWSPQIWPGQQQ